MAEDIDPHSFKHESSNSQAAGLRLIFQEHFPL